MSKIRAATAQETSRDAGAWAFVDIGFSKSAKSCGLLCDDGEPSVMTYANLVARLTSMTSESGRALHLVIEAPLSAAFNVAGNPTGRSIEKRDGKARNWYVGPGAAVLLAATYLLRDLECSSPVREIRLLEGFVSFKPKGSKSSHSTDVIALREVIWNPSAKRGRIFHKEQLASSPSDIVRSSFAVAGMDFGVPPVVLVEG